jgi:hypothetical protein
MRLVRSFRGALLVAALALVASFAAAQEKLAIKGYDPVAYFTDGKPTPGSTRHEAVWREATWRFASAEHRALFLKQPEAYAPQYGGYCAMGVAFGKKAEVDPEAWTIVDGKLYLNYDKAFREKWRAERTAMIKSADEKWREIEAQN